MIGKAITSLETQTNKEKVVASHTLAISEEAFTQAEKLVDEFIEKISALSQVPGKKTQVYHLGVQFFNLTQTKEHKK